MPKLTPKKWIPPGQPAPELIKKIATENSLPDILAEILVNRGLTDKQSVDDFFNPSLEKLPAPLQMKGMHRAASMLHKALEKKLPILIHGDYDADGVSGSALLYLFLKRIGFQVHCFIPDRFKDGYGLNIATLKRIINEEYEEIAGKGAIVITVDCGISDVEEVAFLHENGMQVIITDHHQPPTELPAAEAILNPLQPGCDFPFKHLSGAGVAFFLAIGFRSYLNKKSHWQSQEDAPNLKSFLDLASIGTVADMVPLDGANRLMVRAGLEVMKTSTWRGIQALVDLLNLSNRRIVASDIAFKIAPAINAAGRLGNAKLAFDLLVTDDLKHAGKLAGKLIETNAQRRRITEEMSSPIIEKAAQEIANGKKSLVIYSEQCHQGVIGLIAAKLMYEFRRPAIVLTNAENGLVKGSCRSPEQVNIIDILNELSETLEAFGGHKSAAGVTLKKENIDTFTKEFERKISMIIDEKALIDHLSIDCVTNLKKLFNNDFLAHYQRLEPFGTGNPEPVFAVQEAVKLGNMRVVGRNSLRFVAREDDVAVNGIGFGMGEFIHKGDNAMRISFTIQLNDFRGTKNWEMRAVDISVA